MDIVERLRKAPLKVQDGLLDGAMLLKDAADEIERLRLEIALARSNRDMLPRSMATINDITHDPDETKEVSDARYLQSAIQDGRAREIMDMIREMDSVCAILELQDSFETPTEAIRKLIHNR